MKWGGKRKEKKHPSCDLNNGNFISSQVPRRVSKSDCQINVANVFQKLDMKNITYVIAR